LAEEEHGLGGERREGAGTQAELGNERGLLSLGAQLKTIACAIDALRSRDLASFHVVQL
jgi:hypothetical protein